MGTKLTDRQKKFLSTPSARRATELLDIAYKAGKISIHALREEGDALLELLHTRVYISIHALREEGDQLWKGG